ncbi:MAG: hypothetical protein AUK03_08175 [Anaerolineae bacterium CG2_30_64_16]|nr:MAG: hypothetical protein AUK03_08175 [Anaerolineae bacterium CG2_30_64_16]
MAGGGESLAGRQQGTGLAYVSGQAGEGVHFRPRRPVQGRCWEFLDGARDVWVQRVKSFQIVFEGLQHLSFSV